MQKYQLSKRSLERLRGVHPDLVKIVRLAIQLTEVDFSVLEGVRTMDRQVELYRAKASMTMNSRHLTGHAVDLGAYVDGEIRWDWPLYHKIYDAMSKASTLVGMPLNWGGHWNNFPDGPHFQLPWKDYPKPVEH